MARMIGPMFAESPLLALPLIAMIVFMVVFVAGTARALLRNKEENDAIARAPLDDGHVVRGPGARPSLGGES